MKSLYFRSTVMEPPTDTTYASAPGHRVDGSRTG